jgi:hypothetical protein
VNWREKFFGRGSAPDCNLHVRETSLGVLPSGALLRTIVVSADSRRVAYVARQGCQWFVVVDGNTSSNKYDLPIPFDLPKPFADFNLQQQEELLSVLHNDLTTQEEFVAKIFGRPLFSPDCRRLAYVAYRTVPQQVFRYVPPYRIPVKHHIVVDGDEGEPFDRIVHGSVIFSPDSRRVAYAAERQGEFLIVVDSKEGQRFRDIYHPVFSPSSRHVAYVGGRVGSRSAVIDGEIVSAKYPDVGGGTGVVFSPNEGRMAYAAVAGPDTEFMVIDGKEDTPYQHVGKLFFSPDSCRMLYTAHRAGQSFVVVDRVPGKTYDQIGYPEHPFSPDSQRVAYLAVRNGKHFVVLDGKEEGPYDTVLWLSFSPDSRRVAYRARRASKEFTVVDGREGKLYDCIFTLNFSPNSQQVACFAELAGSCFIAVDGVERRDMVYSFCLGQLIFDKPDRLRTLAARASNRGTELYQVEAEILGKGGD